MLSSILASIICFYWLCRRPWQNYKRKKSLFKQNYSHAKNVFRNSKGNNDKVIELSEKMSANYDKLIDLFLKIQKQVMIQKLCLLFGFKKMNLMLMIETSDKVKKFTQITLALQMN